MTVPRIVAIAALPLAITLGACSPAPSASQGPEPATTAERQTSDSTDQATGANDQQPGSLDPAPEETVATAPPRSLEQEATISDGVTVKVVDVQPITIKPGMPGDIAGPGVRVDLVVKNGSGVDVPLDRVQVNLYMGSDKSPASPSSDSNNKPFPATVKSGKSASGGFAFVVPDAKPFKGSVEVLFPTERKVVTFSGPIN